MLRTLTPEYQDPRKSIYRPVRKAKVDNKEAWNCLSVDWPLETVIKTFSLFDFLRGTLDSSVIVVLLLFILDIEYEDVVLVHSNYVKPIKNNFVDGNSTPFTSIAKREHTRFFNHSKNTLCTIIGITSFFVMTEVPLAAYLFRAVRKKQSASLIIWKQVSIVCIFFNFIVFTAILVYTSKAGLLVDNETWVSKGGSNMRILVYMIIFRTSTFDLTKGCEIIIVNALHREMTRKKKMVSMLEDPQEERELSLSP